MTAEMAGFIDSQRTDHGVPHAVSLRALDVAPSTFYKHLNRPLTQMQVRRQALDAEVKKVFGNSRGTYGSPRVRAQLRRDGIPVSKKTVEASMARQGLSARPNKKKGLTSQNPAHNAPEDLLRRDFSASGVNQKWCGDFKEVKTSEGPVFLATVLDLCSRRMVGFATSDDYPTAELAKAAINTAVATRGGNIDGVIFHSDKGSQYTAGAFAAACQRLGIHRSSGRTGNALDNAPAESFFSTLQHELVDRRSWATKAQARQEISLWVHSWYNQRRLHSAIGMVPPVEYEHTHTPNPHNQPLHEKGGSSLYTLSTPTSVPLDEEVAFMAPADAVLDPNTSYYVRIIGATQVAWDMDREVDGGTAGGWSLHTGLTHQSEGGNAYSTYVPNAIIAVRGTAR